MEVLRTVIYPKDVQLITGRSERYARKLFTAIRNALGKERHQLISVSEFCEYLGLKAEEVRRYLR